MWFWQTSCVGGSERSSTNVKLDGTGIAKFRSKVLQELFQIYGGFFEEHSEDFAVNFETFNNCGGSRGGSGGSVEPPKLNVM